MDVETQEIRLARQRASVKWLLSKAFNHVVPENIKEPFYRDHENQERLKPQIVVELGNATLYCQALSNLYTDPNYQSLNHWSILQTLARKGVQVAERAETPLTETVLIQTNPLRINAHMTVIESLMILYAKEISSGDRIISAIRRISGNNYQPQPSQNCEQSLLAWVAHVCSAIKRRISQEVETGLSDENGIRLQIPDIPPLREFQDLCDGVSLALLICYYCPKYLSWTDVRINYLPAVEDSIHNVLLVNNFSKTHLPYPVFHMTPEDVTYMRGPMKQNLVVLLADLFNLFELHPAKCVCYPEKEAIDIIASRNSSSNEYGVFHRRGVKMQPITSIPDLRSEPDVPLSSPTIRPAFQGFVVYKSRGVTTLSSMQPQQQYQQQESLVPALLRKSKEKANVESKADERGDFVPAGRPSNWEQNRRPSYAGRRSRRNSSSEDSQLTIENFGGSQDQLNLIGRNQERERERKLSNTSAEPAVAVRSSVVDARGTLQIGYDTDSGSEKQDRETEKFSSIHQGSSSENIMIRASNSQLSLIDNNSVHPILNQHPIDKGYCDVNNQQIQPANQYLDLNSSRTSVYSNESEITPKSKSSYFPNNAPSHQNIIHQHYDQNGQYEDDTRSLLDASKLSTIRMKLEEKRRRIEHDKQKIEMAILRHQERDEKESGADSLKWETMSNDSKRISDIDPNDLEKYQQNIATMNSNLQDIQQDIQRLATQQSQIQAQHLQAQQLIQAQKIANVINQQSYGSQQHLAGHYQMRVMQQSNFGSTPHLPQAFNSHISAYNSRPPSRNTQQHMQSQAIPYVNEFGQCIGQETQSTSLMMAPSLFNPQSQGMYNENGTQPTYSNLSYTAGGHPFQSDTLYYHYSPQHPQQQYISRPKEFDDYRSPRREHDPNSPQATSFYLHEAPPQSQQPQRRTWAQPSHEQQQFQQNQMQMHPLVDINAWQSQNMFSKADSSASTWSKDLQKPLDEIILHRNGGVDENGLFPVLSSPQHNRQESPLRQHFLNNQKDNRLTNKIKASNSTTAQTSTDDIMAPQSICFIGDEEDVDEVERNIIESMQSTCLSDYGTVMFGQRLQRSYEHDENEVIGNKFNITSGNLTYRIPSPSRPSINAKSFQSPHEKSNLNEKGFYISFDDEQPKRPKPPLRAKRSPKKEKSLDIVDHHVDHALFASHEPLIEQSKFSDNDSKQNNSNKINNLENNNATYNKYTDAPIQLKHLAESSSHFSLTNSTFSSDRRHLEDVTNQQQPISPTICSSAARQHNNEPKGKALVIGTDVSNLDPESVDEMERRKEKIMLLSLQRRQQQEEAKARKEIEANKRREREREKEEARARKKEEQMTRRATILEQHRLKKAIEDAEREGKTLDRSEIIMKQQSQIASVPRLRHQKIIRPRPKTIHVDNGSADISEASSISSRGKKGSTTNLTGYGQLTSNSMRRDYFRGSQDSLTVKESPDDYPSTSSTPIGRRGSYRTSREPTVERGRTLSRISVAKGNNINLRGRKSNSLINLCDTDSGLGRATPPRRAPSPGLAGRHMPSPSGPGSLPPGLVSKRRGFDDGSSDVSSTQNSLMEYSGPKLYKQPAAKSNRGIILNAVEYCVFPGAVNRDAKQKVLEKIARSEAKHFLVLFRDAGCQFRALYSYSPDSNQVVKLYGTGPSQVDEVMFDKFFKYNSGGKCFSQVHTKHLTVTIDAFTIHNSLWQGKKVHLPSKKDMTLVI